MGEKFCKVCTAEIEGCYMKMSKEINEAAGILLEPTENIYNEEERRKNGQDIGLAVNKEITQLRDKAREDGCKNVNNILTDDTCNEYL